MVHIAAGPSCPSSAVAYGRRCVAILPWLFCAVITATHQKGTDRSSDSSQFPKSWTVSHGAWAARPKYATNRGGMGAVRNRGLGLLESCVSRWAVYRRFRGSSLPCSSRSNLTPRRGGP